MINEGLKLTLVGMGFVGFFLVIMIGCMKIMSSFFKGEVEEEEEISVPLQEEQPASQSNIIAAISAAIKKYQERK